MAKYHKGVSVKPSEARKAINLCLGFSFSPVYSNLALNKCLPRQLGETTDIRCPAMNVSIQLGVGEKQKGGEEREYHAH